MISLPIMKKPLISRVVEDVISQRDVPSLSPRSFAPVRFDSANQARERRLTPKRCRRDYANCIGRTLTDLRRNSGIDRLAPFRNAICPKDHSSPFHDIGHRGFEPIAFDILHHSQHRVFFCDALRTDNKRDREYRFGPSLDPVRKSFSVWTQFGPCFTRTENHMLLRARGR